MRLRQSNPLRRRFPFKFRRRRRRSRNTGGSSRGIGDDDVAPTEGDRDRL